MQSVILNKTYNNIFANKNKQLQKLFLKPLKADPIEEKVKCEYNNLPSVKQWLQKTALCEEKYKLFLHTLLNLIRKSHQFQITKVDINDFKIIDTQSRFQILILLHDSIQLGVDILKIAKDSDRLWMQLIKINQELQIVYLSQFFQTVTQIKSKHLTSFQIQSLWTGGISQYEKQKKIDQFKIGIISDVLDEEHTSQDDNESLSPQVAIKCHFNAQDEQYLFKSISKKKTKSIVNRPQQYKKRSRRDKRRQVNQRRILCDKCGKKYFERKKTHHKSTCH